MDASVLELIVKGGGGTLILYLLAQAAPKFLDSLTAARATLTDNGARTSMIEQMAAQIARLNQSVIDLEAKYKTVNEQLDEARRKRFDAEERVEKLQRRVTALEAQIKELGYVPV